MVSDLLWSLLIFPDPLIQLVTVSRGEAHLKQQELRKVSKICTLIPNGLLGDRGHLAGDSLPPELWLS